MGYSQGMVNAVLVVMFCLGLLVNVDHGALPAALRDISQSLNLDESVMGTMGSAVFFGLILGSCTASFIFKKFSYKLIIVSSLVLNGLSLGLFAAGSNFNFMLFARVISGFSQIFIIIYLPLYVDMYITKKWKPTVLSLLMVAVPFSDVAGYTMTSVCILNKGFWKSEEKHFWY